MQETYKRIGILGGTFDPVHYGHLITAETVREAFQLDKVLFIPSGQPPHKDNSRVLPAEHRFHILKAAAGSNPFFEVSRIEIEREGYTFTVDTLSQLRNVYNPHTKIFFIIGADVVPDLVTWRNFQKVFTLCEFIAVFRPGSNKNAFSDEIHRLETEYMAKIHTAEVPLIDISSTEIRSRAKEGKTIKYLVPECVEEYIKTHGIYLKKTEA
ncbi:MAG: nicotinate-nucleotide adenylyltransferase [Clostridia bacterium]|nr:nicotinate-nucleotide adenylyltransferase [Clostridia bacterium]